MFLFKKPLAVTTFTIISLLIFSDSFAANIYVDKTLSSSCTTGNYSTANRNCNGTEGNAYITVQQAVNSMSSGDDIYIRGGTYYENVDIGGNQAQGTSGDWNSIQSYIGEWAIIDGQNNAPHTIGKYTAGVDRGEFIKYWRIEKLGITGGSDNGAQGKGAGIFINGGPFIIRYCHIYENQSVNVDNNVAGIAGYGWTDQIIEYNWLHDNGLETPNSSETNSSNIAPFADYNNSYIAANGYTPDIESPKRGEIRYNYIDGSSFGFKHKSGQLFTGRNPDTADFVDTYSDYGDKIHHNFFTGQDRTGLMIEQDFAQVYNNIFDNQVEAINVQYEPRLYQIYKVLVYNNTIKDASEANIVRYGGPYYSWSNSDHYGWDLNNLIDGSDKSHNGWTTTVAISLFVGNAAWTGADISNYINSNNYIYQSSDPDIFKFESTFYTASEFESQTKTGGPRVAYTNSYDTNNPLYAGTTNANRFITLGSHIIEGSKTIANGGIGGPHPYLSGVTLPSYVGAVDPNDSSWVANLLCLADIEVLKNGSADGPVCSKRPKAMGTVNATVIR